MDLVLFDLDNTLINGDSDVEWGKFLIGQGVLDRTAYETGIQKYYGQYLAGTLNILEYMDFVLRPLTAYPRSQLDVWHAEFLERHIRPLITERARDAVRCHQASGALMAVVTATNSFVTGPIAAALCVPHLIATQAEESAGRLTGRVVGDPCFREGKVARVDQFLAARGQGWSEFEKTWCYSDSYNDLPLLSRVDVPVAVNPDERLRSHAEERGWQILEWR